MTEMTDEERLRAEANKRMERRRRKMESAEDRLARITGQPASSRSDASFGSPVSSLLSSPGSPVFSDDSLTTEPFGSVSPLNRDATDPPLENLSRSPLRDAGAGPRVEPVIPCSNLVWVAQAAVTVAFLKFGYGDYIGNSVFPMFILLVITLLAIRRLSFSSTAGGLISAALMLCGLSPKLVQTFIQSFEVMTGAWRYLALYLTSFILLHQATNAVFTS